MPATAEDTDADLDLAMTGDLGAMMAEAKRAFVEWAKPALEEVEPEAAKLATSGFAQAREAVFAVFHDLKGAGGGVGLDLVTEIGDSCCEYLRELEADDGRSVKVVMAHLTAARRVLDAGIEGDGGAVGTAIVDKLRAYAESGAR